MAQFLNQEPNPQEKDSAKGATLKPAPERVDWNDAGDNGLNALERASLLAQAKTPATTAAESFASGMGNSIIAAAIRKASAPAFDRDPNFNAKQTLSSDTRAKLYAPNQEEIEYLHDSVSVEDYNYRMQQMLEQRDRDRLMADNTVAGFAGMLVGDSPFILAPMSAAGIAGRAGLAARTAIRAADVGTAFYAQDQLGQSAAVTALIAGVAGLDQLWDMSRAAKAAAKARTGREPMFDPEAPITRTARDANVTGVGEGEEILTKALDESIQVSRNNTASVNMKAQHVVQFLKKSEHLTAGQKAILDTLGDAVNDIDFKLVAGSANRSRYTYAQQDLAKRGEISLRAPKQANGSTWTTVGDALRAMDADTSKVAVHELIHAATARAIDSNPEIAKRLEEVRTVIAADSTLTPRMRYYASNVHEMLAGLGDSPEWVEHLARTQSPTGKSMLRQLGEYIMNALGIKAKGSALEDVLDAYEDAVKWTAKDYADQAQSFRSEAFQDLAGSTTLNEAKRAQAMLDGAKKKLSTMFALYDNIAQGNEDLAKLLVSDATAVGGRRPSVVDYKRNLTLEMDARASVVEDAILGALKDKGVGVLSRFFHRSNFRAERAALEDRLSKYLDAAYSADVNGRAVPVPDAEIAPLVDAYRRSGWASKWHEHMLNAGLVDDGALVKSDYYFPRQYSYDKMRQGIAQGNTLDDYRALFRAALRDVYPSMESEVVQRVAKEMVDGIYNGRAGQSGPMWKQLINGMGNDEVVMAMRSAGVEESAIQSFLAGNVRESGSTSPARNLRQRTRFNMDKEYMINGKSMRMQDLMDTDVAKVMHGYTNRMSGRVGMAYAGVQDLGQLAKMIDESKHALADSAKWEKTVNDTIDFILGGAPSDAGQLPDLLRAAGNMANATMLKNSGLYQLTDTALAMKEFGMARVLRSMRDQPWFKEGAVAIKTPDMAARLDTVLRGNIQKEMRFRWLNTYADDNLDLTRQASWFNVTQNVGQAARHVNGMSMVHRLQVNLNSGIVADELTQMFKGDAEAFKRLERFGLTRDVADRAIAANKANPGAMFQPDLQMQVEGC
ncbi:internal virion protein with endolysin domain [Klebsiella phage vB_Kpn_K24PH164C1]|uniref:Internal virion protein with endolysin domain n=1 Tax=Klebsiella phage vB_Kpn_K24PH164C1 TaxID=3071676 RepID=A0AAD2GR32_9CAUD|nr:internal virion protein with endolysin domain [Klebsiella phage vB_Kpn_K24PH164C1]